MKVSAPEFLQDLRKFVHDEANTQYRALERQWSHPLQECVARGWAIEGLRVEEMRNGIARLSCATNDSRFREGDLDLLHRYDPHDPDALHFDLQYEWPHSQPFLLLRPDGRYELHDKNKHPKIVE